ncbi:MAG TPA: M1 family aminopeptidase [Elusimicrobiota bacterium]|nr:M1 family aminopeptidase [Elusimicrobiota bacterium]
MIYSDENQENRRTLSGLFFDSRFVLKGTRPQYASDRSFRTEHIRLELDLDFPKKTLNGSCLTDLRAIVDQAGTVSFDAVNFKILGVDWEGRLLRHRYDGRRLDVTLPKPLEAGARVSIRIRYRVVKPVLGLFFVGPDKAYPSKPIQAWTQGEDEYARYWFPCQDAPRERTTTEMLVTVPSDMTAVSNGALVRIQSVPSKNKRLFHWKQSVPHPPYLVSLVAGRLSVIRDHWKKVPVLYYCPPGREDDARRSFGKTPTMIDFFSRSLGVPYPYAKYAQVAAVDFIYGGMENSSATTQTAFTLHDERAHMDFSSDPLVAHELAHQWFGDWITCKDWSHAWLNESFATYFEALYKEHDLGKDEFLYLMRENAEAYFSEDKEHYRRPMVTRVYKQPGDLFDRHLYEKGACILHMVRYLLGDRLFWKAMHTYVVDHQGSTVETVDLVNALQKSTGRDFWRFFDEWIHRSGHPEYKVRFWWEARRKEMCVRVVQTQNSETETGLFSLPVVFSFRTSTGEKRFTETVEKRDHLFRFKLSEKPDLFLFDPEQWILKKMDIVKPESMWIVQLSSDPNVLGRIDAAKVLGQYGSQRATEALSKALLEEGFWGVQSAVAAALGRIHSRKAFEGLRAGLQDVEHPKARRAIIEALGEFRDQRLMMDLREMASSEKSYFCAAECLRSLGKMGDPSVLIDLKKALQRESWNDVFRVAALNGIARLNPPEAVGLFREYSAYGCSIQVRRTAIQCLARIGLGLDEVQEYLLTLLQDPSISIQLETLRALGQLGDERAVPALRKMSTGDRDGRIKRLADEVLQKITKGIEKI